MSTVPLPDNPSLDQLRQQARDLQRAVRGGDPAALARVEGHHPRAVPAPDERPAFALSAAQLVVAKSYGFASWPRLVRHLDVVTEFMMVPERVEPSTDPGEEFLRLACLSWGNDTPDWRVQARRLLAEHPDIAAANIHAAATAADTEQVRRFLEASPSLAGRRGGPFGWVPLFYLAYDRHDPDIGVDAVLGTARLLLDHGADPNAGYLWHGLPTPFTVLTGIFGDGEEGRSSRPPHPHSLALARVVLEAGADPNDGQTLYNRMFRESDDHLELLFEFGLGSGDGGPWKVRLGDQLDGPAEMVRGLLNWAVTHDQLARVRLLVEHGVDFRTPFGETRMGWVNRTVARTACELAALSGSRRIVDYLVSQGATAPDFDPVDAFVVAALAGDRAEIGRLRAAHPDLAVRARGEYPALILRATVNHDPDAVALLAELGFDVNAMGRADAAGGHRWETALHEAAGTGDLVLIGRLLELGADPDGRDARFDSTPLGWARHLNQPAAAELLEPVTADEPARSAPA